MAIVVAALNARSSTRVYELVPYAEWFSSLEAHLNEDNALERFPALRLISFFRAGLSPAASSPHRESMGLALLQTHKTRAASPALDSVLPLGERDVAKWLTYWGDRGLFDVRV